MDRRAFIALCGAVVACPTVPAPRAIAISNPYLTETALQEIERAAVRPVNIHGRDYYFVLMHPTRTWEVFG